MESETQRVERRRAEAFVQICGHRRGEFVRGREVGPGPAGVAQIGRRRAQRRDEVHLDVERREHPAQRGEVRVIVKAQQRWPEDVDRARRAIHLLREVRDDLFERECERARLIVAHGMRRSHEDLGFDITRCEHPDFAVERFLQHRRGCRAGDHEHLRVQARVDLAQHGGDIGRRARQGRLGHRAHRNRRYDAQPLEHREHDCAVAVALGGAQNGMDVGEGRRGFADSDVRRCLIRPQCKLHARAGSRKNVKSIGVAAVCERSRVRPSASCRRIEAAKSPKSEGAPLKPWMG